MSDQPETIDRLAKRLAALERRVDALEHPLAARWPRPSTEPETQKAEEETAGALAQTGSLFPVLGRAMLGIAGAYVLRAVAESTVLPRATVAAAGIVYAFLWLMIAARARRGPEAQSVIYACTSALILAPMLWELTLRFGVLPAAMAAAVLCVYTMVAFALGWRREMAPVLRVSWIAAAGLALALAIASHVFVPFIATLLILAVLGELAPGRTGMPEMRAVAALTADAAIWILIFISFNPQGARTGYPLLSKAVLLAPGVAIFVLFAVSVSVRTIARAKAISAFETLQTTIAFLLAAVSVADFGPASSAMILGVACLIFATASYAAVFTVFAGEKHARNRSVFAAWSAALVLCGCWMCFAPAWAGIFLGGVAVAAMLVGRSKSWPASEMYGALFLLASMAASGWLSFVGGALAGTPAGVPAFSVWMVAGCAVACFAAMRPRADESRTYQAVHLLLAALAVTGVVSLLVQGLVGLTALRVIPGAHHLAFIRTLTLCAAALAMAFAGARWQVRELTRLGYTALAVVAVKLVAEDLRHGHLEYVAGSIFLFALTLIAAPRMARVRQKA